MARPQSFVVSAIAFAAVAALALTTTTTSCSPGFGTYPTWDGSYPDVELPNVDLFPYLVCQESPMNVVYDEALMGAAPDALDQGANDVSLSPPKTYPGGDKPASCLHLRVSRDAGGVITERRLVWLKPNKNITLLEEHVLYRMKSTPSGVTEETDPNGDGALEQVAEVSVDQAGAWTGTVTNTYDGPSKRPIRRITTAPKDTLVSAIREERWNGTTWNLELDAEIDRDQTKCVSEADIPPPPTPRPGSKNPTCKVITCSKAQRDQILDGMKQALRKSENCAPSAITSKPATELASGLLEPVCMTGAGCGYGETTSEGTPTKDAKRPVKINVDHLGSDQFMPTVWHELVHIGLGDRGAHPELKQKLAAVLGKGLLVDRTYACEMMCFPPKNVTPTQCDCAACIDEVIMPDGSTKRATRCSQQCAGFADCTAAGNSPDTGAYCARGKTFCDTVGECRTACAASPDSCGPKDPKTGFPRREGGNMSRACDPQCD